MRKENENITQEEVKAKIVQLVRNKYDIQKLRIATGNRIVQAFNAQMGQKPSTKQEDMDQQAQKVISVIKKEYNRVTDGYIENNISIKKQIDDMNGNNELVYIRSKMDYDLMDEYMGLLKIEEQNKKVLKYYVQMHPIWDGFFADIKGVGEETAAMCIAYLDPYKARHVANFWSYCGLNPVNRIKDDGTVVTEANSKKYTQEYEYTDAEGNTKTKKGITYNPNLHTMLLGVTASCLLKANLRTDKETGYKIASGTYCNAYCDYKIRQMQKHPDYSALHIEKMSCRYMIRILIRDLWVAWRQIEGLPVTVPYEEEFLGRAPHKWPNLETYQFPKKNQNN